MEDITRHFFSVSGQERAVYFRSLATMFRAGIPLDRSLELLAEQNTGELGKASLAVAKLILGGSYLSGAMVQFPWVFTPLQRRLVQVGERAGALGEVLEKISAYEEFQVALKLRIRNAMTLPAIVCTACLAMVVVLPPLLFKGLFQMLEGSSVAVPFITQVVMVASDIFRSPLFWGLAALGAMGATVALYRAQSDAVMRYKISRFLKGLPMLGKTLQFLAVTRFARSLETMVAVGLPILGALELAAQATDNAYFEEEMMDAIELVKEGEPIYLALESTGLFPVSFISGMEVASQVGQMEHMLGSLANLYDRELDFTFEVLAASIEPFVLALVGAIVGFVVIATMLPMVRLLETL